MELDKAGFKPTPQWQIDPPMKPEGAPYDPNIEADYPDRLGGNPSKPLFPSIAQASTDPSADGRGSGRRVPNGGYGYQTGYRPTNRAGGR